MRRPMSALSQPAARHVMLVIASLAGGGAERVASLLAAGFHQQGRRVTLVTLLGRDLDFFTLPSGIERIALDLPGHSPNFCAGLASNLRRIRALRRTIRDARPDAVIAFMPQTNVLAVLAAGRRDPPVIVTEHADPRRFPLSRVWEHLRSRTYRRAARVVSVSPSVDACFAWLPESKRLVIPNPIDVGRSSNAAEDVIDFGWPHTAIALGRLAPEKGFDLLIEAFARVAADFPDWGLAILGEGCDRTRLESLIERHNLAGRVCLTGAVANPFPTLRAADLFVLSSTTEGFGNVLVEAQACGLPVVATDCWDGPQELVRDGVEGLLVPPGDVAALSAALRRMMADGPLRRACATHGTESAQRFALDRVMLSWDAALRGIVDC
jgi:GalNAc-alpha-(1->4)-GalNAc-alpha-(1->3)-diNAcBac-PP-undecaprenol alpha-1,4-N-acetyl-D-galactosaminyltransferase